MKKKKIIITSIFLVLIAITAIYTITSAVLSYRYHMSLDNPDLQKWAGMGAAFILMVGGFIVFYESDLFYTVYYFIIRPKTVLKSIIVVLSNFTLILIFFSEKIADFVKIHFHKIVEGPYEDSIIPMGLFWIYVILKIVIWIIGLREEMSKDISDL